MKKKYLIILILAAISLISAFFVEPQTKKVDTGALVDFIMDENGSFYVLSFENADKNYHLLKVSPSGELLKEVILESSNDENFSYRQICLGNDFNIYLLRQSYNIPGNEKSLHGNQDGILKEEVVKYGVECQFLGVLASIDFSDEIDLPESSFIDKLQVVNDKITILCNKGNDYEIMEVDKEGKEKPKSLRTFKISPPVKLDPKDTWISDAAITKNNSVIYVNKRGELFMKDSDAEAIDLRKNLGSSVVPSMLSIDEDDNIYFSDINEGTFYKFIPSSLNISPFYGVNSIINEFNKTTILDLSSIFVVKNGLYCGLKKAGFNRIYAGFGTKQIYIDNVDYVYYERVFEFLIEAIIIFAVLFLLYKFIVFILKKYTLMKKVLIRFIPIYVSIFGILFYTCLSMMINTHTNGSILEVNEVNKIFLNNVDADKFSQVNYLNDYMSKDYVDVRSGINTGFDSVKGVSDKMIVYSYQGDQIYYLFDNYDYRDNVLAKDNADLDFVKLPKCPIEFMTEESLAKKYYDAWNILKNPNYNSYTSFSYKDRLGSWTCVLNPIKNSSNKVVGMIENRFDDERVRDSEYRYSLNVLIFTIIGAFILIFVLLYIILWRSFKPVKEIKKGLEIISKGKWSMKLKTNSYDEFSDICKSLNDMTDDVYTRISNLVLLNEEYIKYVPKEMFLLLDKTKVTEVSLTDQSVKKLHILNVNFDKAYNDSGYSMSEKDYIDSMQDAFEELFETIERNNGIIQNFDGLKMVILFLKSADDAIKTSMQIKDVFSNIEITRNMQLILSSGKTFIGVIGSSEHMTIAALSDEIIMINKLQNKIGKISLKHIATESTVKLMEKENNYNYRFIGQVPSVSSNEPIKLYEFIDAQKSLDNNRYILSKDVFEQGVKSYIDDNLIQARKCFVEVLSNNRKDEVAMHYLKLCDKFEKLGNKKQWKGYILEY